MKKIKKYLGIFLTTTAVILSTNQMCFAVQKTEIRIPLGNGIYITVRLNKNKNLTKKIKEIIRHLRRHRRALILDGGSYGNTVRADGFECHHLISCSFCKAHGISMRDAPSMLIPKGVHRLTGSHPCSRRSRKYFLEEKSCFDKFGLHGVVELGTRDLIGAFKEYEHQKNPDGAYLHSSDVVLQSPVKSALKQTGKLSPGKQGLNPISFLTPEKGKAKCKNNLPKVPFEGFDDLSDNKSK